MGNDKSPFLTLSTASKYASLTLLSDRGCGSNVTHQQERRTSKQTETRVILQEKENKEIFWGLRTSGDRKLTLENTWTYLLHSLADSVPILLSSLKTASLGTRTPPVCV